MLRISRKSAVIHLLIAMSLSSCTNNLSATPPVISQLDQEWFGMEISPDQWQAEEIQDAMYQHGLLTHLTLTDCRAWIMSEDPVYINGYTPDWSASTLEQFPTAETRIDLRRMKDLDGNLRDIYFEVFDTTGRTGFEELRLAYIHVEPGENPGQCLEAVYAILITLQPDLFPNLGTDQG